MLRSTCGCSFLPFSIRWSSLVCLGSVVILTFIATWAPIVWTGQLQQAISRLFPFGRGLTHAYWAPNVWAFYNTADLALAKVLRVAKASSTAGLAEVFEHAVLWSIPPKLTFVLAISSHAPLFWAIWRQQGET